MYDQPLTADEIIAMLAAGPERITAILAGLSPAQLVTAPDSEWSARDVLAHLRACGDMWGKYIKMILREDHPTIKAMNPRTWIQHTDYLEQEFAPSFASFAEQRAALVDMLRSLKPEEWERTARVTGAGKALERSVYTYAEWLANHERSHLRQFRKIAETLRAGPAD